MPSQPRYVCPECGKMETDDPFIAVCEHCGCILLERGHPPPAPPAEDTERKAFWRAGMTACLRCGARVSRTREVENCRMDGDAYGLEHYRCTACDWSTSFKFDEAAAPMPYLFETYGWEK